jgi:hypothetical protein
MENPKLPRTFDYAARLRGDVPTFSVCGPTPNGFAELGAESDDTKRNSRQRDYHPTDVLETG